MKRLAIAALSAYLFNISAFAQLTTFQKQVDFQQLVALYNKRYAPYEWKKTAIHYDAFNLTKWLDRINKSPTDLDFFEICSEYVTSLQDAHSAYLMPSIFLAQLGFSTDVYSGKVLVDGTDDRVLDTTMVPLQIGDEIISMDGKSADELIAALLPFMSDGNPLSARRSAANHIPYRDQDIVPNAYEVGDTAELVIRRQSGETLTFSVPWQKGGTPYVSAGPVGDPQSTSAGPRRAGAQPPASANDPLHIIRQLDTYRLAGPRMAIGMGQVQPIFALPDNFESQGLPNESVYAGTFQVDGLKIGYLRIPTFELVIGGVQQAVQNLMDTDALVVDIMRNPGGYGCEAEEVAQALSATEIHSIGRAVRVTWSDLLGLQDALSYAQVLGTKTDIDTVTTLLKAFNDAYSRNRGLTDPVPICGASTDLPALQGGYPNPILLLTDEFSASAAEMLAAILQDNHRVRIYGNRTNGAGGSIDFYAVGYYSEGGASVTRSLMVRDHDVVTDDYPAAPYVENIGVRPDITVDYMTTENLLQNGKPFVDGFVKAVVELAKSGRSGTSRRRHRFGE